MTSILSEDAYESNIICARWIFSKRIFHLKSNKIAAFAESDRCFKGQPPAQFG